MCPKMQFLEAQNRKFHLQSNVSTPCYCPTEVGPSSIFCTLALELQPALRKSPLPKACATTQRTETAESAREGLGADASPKKKKTKKNPE